MEKGNYVPTLLLAFRIADYFQVPLTEIFQYNRGNNNDLH